MAARRRYLRQIAKSEDAPEWFNGCKFWKLMEDQRTGTTFPSACRVCDGCRYHIHESLVSKLLAEAQASAATLSVTFTYDPNGDKPEGAEWLDYDDLIRFFKRLRKAGFEFRKFVSGEYGTANGRAHWHVLLFFQWDKQHLEWWRSEQLEVDWKGNLLVESHDPERRRDWRNFVPPLYVGVAPKQDFLLMLDDPDLLWVPTVGYKKGGDYRQKWKFWKHGLIEAQIVKAPGVGTEDELNRGVRYVAKYFSKDPWKDGKNRHVPFEKLPEWIKQSTAYGPWDLDGTNERQKWVRGNAYGDAIDEQNLRKYPSDDLVPVSERRKKHRHMAKAVGGLGREYFRCLGAWYARQVGGQEDLVKRSFKLGPSYRRKHIEAVQKSLRNGKSPLLQHRNKFFMGDTAFRQFGQGFNQYLSEQGRDETTGPDHIFETLETAAAVNSDMSSGATGYHIWKKANRGQRVAMEQNWADLPNERLAGIVPQRLIRLLEDTSSLPGWQKKRRARLERNDRGAPKRTTAFADFRIIETTQKRFFYEKDLKAGTRWFGREILTVENLDAALCGELLALNARAMRVEREGKGDLRFIDELDIRTVRRRIKKAQDEWLCEPF